MFPLQFISHQNEHISYEEGCLKALEGGCRWIQLRMKESTEDEVAHIAERLKPIIKDYDAVLLLDDHVNLCKQLNVHGVHIGKNDMPPAEARSILGDKYIIGGTCNTFDDIQKIHSHVDYIGCGPFRYTTTKKNLAPVLGLDGYRDIIWQCRSNNINTPIVAIGGITEADVLDVINAGPNGIALSGEILNAPDPVRKIHNLIKLLGI
ncbi:MAG: thiamine phosphate synthase [Bacteroidia bacterium]|nr:thiamine phosphate synthase [Bacteroidia bacterium]